MVRHIIPTDVLSFEGFGSDDDYRGPLWYSPAGCVPIERLKIMADLVYDHVLVEDVLGRRVNQAVTVSDYLSLHQFKLTPIYNEFFRHINTDRQMTVGLFINTELIITTSLCRVGKDFSTNERSVMELLTPHLVSAFRNAKFIERLRGESALLPEKSESARCGSISIDDGYVRSIANPSARRLLWRYFGWTADSLPDDLLRYVKHHLSKWKCDDYYHPPVPFEIHGETGMLRIRMIYRSLLRSAVLLLEELPAAASSKSSPPLTLRETEILDWISHGKTDGEIGVLLNISVRTVHKHVEHIFEKLGVETRTAAMATFLETRKSY